MTGGEGGPLGPRGSQKPRRSWLGAGTVTAVLVLGLLSLCVCVALVLLGALLVVRSGAAKPLPSETPDLVAATLLPTTTFTPTPTATPVPTRAATREPDPAMPTATAAASPTSLPEPVAFQTEGRLLAAVKPQRDLRLLAERLTNQGPIAEVVRSTPLTYQVGDQAQFWVGNVDSLEHTQISAVLAYATEHLYMWVQEGLAVDLDALTRSAEVFETHIYPTTRALFGSEWSPGVDGDPRLYILNASSQQMGRSVAGYYSSADEYSNLANPYSNEHEMFYVAIGGGMSPGSEYYHGVLIHEFQHMIHWFNDRNEDTWVNEGCSELASHVGGYDAGGFDWSYLSDPDLQLTTWAELDSSASHYGASYLFMLYLYERFGSDLIRDLVAHPADGTQGLDAVLAGHGLGFEDVFADWLIANYVDGTWSGVAEVPPRYTYPDEEVGPASLDDVHRSYPTSRQSTVSQYGADYVELWAEGDLRINFEGKREVNLVPADAYSGRHAWWSNRGDDTDTTLDRAFDLRALEGGSATLSVRMWYDIEPDWDYAYVQVSADVGETWEILAGPSTTTEDPNGNSYGAAYTGSSSGWIEEAFDLSAYAGQEVLVRFEYVTDDAVNRAGWLIDDICILETGFCDDLESGSQDWEARGFVYSDNRVGQRYLVQVIWVEQGETLRVEQMSLDDAQRGALELRGVGPSDHIVLVISALAPVTTVKAPYEYSIERLQ